MKFAVIHSCSMSTIYYQTVFVDL